MAARAVNVSPATQTSSLHGPMLTFFVRLRGQSQYRLFALVGAIAGFCGAILAGIAVQFVRCALHTPSELVSESLLLVVTTTLKFGALGGALSALTFVCMRWYHRRRSPGLMTLAVAMFGFFAGAIPAGLLQLLANAVSDSREPDNPTVSAAALILLAALLGTGLSRFIPNLQSTRGLIAGLAAGLVAALVPIVTAGLGLPLPVSFPVGSLILGGAFGTAMSVTERRFRDCLIEIQRDPEQSTLVGLGPQAITIGGGKDEIFIVGAPEHVSCLAVRNGQIEHVEMSTGKLTALQNGSRLRVGGLIMVVHANQRAARPRGIGPT